MVGRIDRRCRRTAKGILAVMTVGVLTACSTVPDAINPVEWYKGASDFVTGRERPEVAGPAPAKAENTAEKTAEKTADRRKDVAKGLVADRGKAQYAEPVRREVTPTRPLARRAPAADTQVAAAKPAAESKSAAAPAAAPQTAAAPAVPPKPAVQAGELPPAPVQVAQAADAQPRVSPDRPTPTARGDRAPSAPPAAVDMQPPPRPDIPETVPMPGKGPKRLQQQFEKRLAESAQQVVRPDIVDIPGRATLARAEEAPIHLVPPGTGKRRTGGGKGMAAPQPAPGPAASFQVASVDFASGATLTSADRAAIAEVARLYKQTGGVVRVVGHAPAPGFGAGDAVSQLMGGLEASMNRANAVARELSKRGVPASKIMVAADPGMTGMGATGAQVYLDVM